MTLFFNEKKYKKYDIIFNEKKYKTQENALLITNIFSIKQKR